MSDPQVATADVVDADAVAAKLADAANAEYDAGSVDETVGRASSTDVVSAINGLNNLDNAFYSSIRSDDWSAKIKNTQAITSSTPIDEHLGEELDVVNFVILPVELMDKNSGEVVTAPRVILLTADDNAYHGTSIGLLSAVRNILAGVGEPATWPAALKIKVVQQKGNNGFKFFTIKLV